MDNKNMTEKESLELITHMIQNAKYKMAENAGMPFLIWGYLTSSFHGGATWLLPPI